MTTKPDLMMPSQVASMFDVCARTVLRWSQRQNGPRAIRTPGGHRRLRRADVFRFLWTESPLCLTCHDVGYIEAGGTYRRCPQPANHSARYRKS